MPGGHHTGSRSRQAERRPAAGVLRPAATRFEAAFRLLLLLGRRALHRRCTSTSIRGSGGTTALTTSGPLLCVITSTIRLVGRLTAQGRGSSRSSSVNRRKRGNPSSGSFSSSSNNNNRRRRGEPVRGGKQIRSPIRGNINLAAVNSNNQCRKSSRRYSTRSSRRRRRKGSASHRLRI